MAAGVPAPTPPDLIPVRACRMPSELDQDFLALSVSEGRECLPKNKPGGAGRYFYIVVSIFTITRECRSDRL